LVVGPSTAKHGPIPLTLMLAKSVTFAPQLRGTLACARSPRHDQAYWGVREVLVPISSTKTKRSGLVAAATITRQAALKNSSLSLAPTDLFFESIPGP
jgi:hypothetical protein